MAWGLLCAVPADAAEPSLAARLACETVKRVVVCAVRMDASVGSRITWAQADIVETPPFLQPVRAHGMYTPDPTRRPVIYLALTPKGGGQGEIGVDLRAIVCHDDTASCPHSHKRLRGNVSVPAR